MRVETPRHSRANGRAKVPWQYRRVIIFGGFGGVNDTPGVPRERFSFSRQWGAGGGNRSLQTASVIWTKVYGIIIRGHARKLANS